MKIKQMPVLKIDFAEDVDKGLSKTNKTLPTKYIYDDAGTELFEQIMDLPEYYLPNCEIEIFETYKKEWSEKLKGTSFNLIELGAGNGIKTKIILEQFLKDEHDFTYIPIDISELAISKLLTNLESDLPDLNCQPMIGDYFEQMNLLKKEGKKNVVLFLGSNIGNYNKQDSLELFNKFSTNLNKDDWLIVGFDLQKEERIILNAYDDSKGVTKDFHLNLLKRINAELDGNFVLNQFDYYTRYNREKNTIESFIKSKVDQDVYIEACDKTFTFLKDELIHTEYSFKFSLEQIKSLAEATGFTVEKNYMDSKNYFSDSLLIVE